MTIPKAMFRAYDIRGTYPDQLNAENALYIGKGFASYLVNELKIEKPRVVVGRDNRIHSEELQNAFIEGLVTSGCSVFNIGHSPTPYLYFSTVHGAYDAGCNITASHNPKQYNGFKLVTGGAHAVFGDELQKLYQMITEENFISGEGSVESHDYKADYLKKLQSIFQFPRTLKVVVDSANGISGMLYPQMIRDLGHEVVELYTELDGEFPNHEPDPIVESNLADLKQRVLDENADIGLSFDGDGDRVGIVTETGQFMDSDKTLMLLAKDALLRNPSKSVVFTVSNSQVLFDLVKEWGGNPVMCKVGHSFVEDAMTLNAAVIGGEQSGHFFLPESYYSFDDALVAALRVLLIATTFSEPISTLYNQFPQTFSLEELRPKCDDVNKFEVIERVKAHFEEKYPSNTLDGIRIDFGNGGWAGIRASNTSPRISITMEAKDPRDLKHISSEVLDHLKTYSEIDWEQ